MEQTEEEDLLPAAGVRPLFCLLVASLTGTDEWKRETDDLMDKLNEDMNKLE